MPSDSHPMRFESYAKVNPKSNLPDNLLGGLSGCPTEFH